MSRSRALVWDGVFVACGMAAGALSVGAIAALSDPGRSSPEPRHKPPVAVNVMPKRTAPASAGTVILAWSPQGLPHRLEEKLQKVNGVRRATTVRAGTDWLRRSRTSDGTVLDQPPGSYAIPLEVAAIKPRDYAPFVSPTERNAVLGLGPGEALIARTEAKLRGTSQGLTLSLSGRRLRIVGVIGDEATNGYEVLVSQRSGSPTNRESFLLIQMTSPGKRQEVERAVRRHFEPDRLVRVRSYGETPYLRYGDAVLPQLTIKEAFGEFAGRPDADGSITLEPGWAKKNIRTASVPLLGSVTCHRALFPQLRAAMTTLIREGLQHSIDRSQYAGCFNPRFINRNTAGRLSHHAWGVALDLNSRDNAFGIRPRQDRRLVRVMEDHGFTWGGRWLIPDGMHFEWARFP